MAKNSHVPNDAHAVLNEPSAAASVYSDTTSTLYASSVLEDTDSTLYASSIFSASTLNDNDDTSTLVGGGSHKQLSRDDLQQMRIVVAGIGAPKTSNKVVHHCLLSVRTLLRKDYQDLINDRFIEKFRILKSYADLLSFDTSLRLQGYRGEPLLKKSVFCSHAPLMIDQRKILLEVYFRDVLNQQCKDSSLIVDFFNTDKDITSKQGGVKEGYLLKKEGVMFGKWIAQYFILTNTLHYYDQKGGNRLGSIPLKDMAIGEQSANYEGSDYRHGLIIKKLLNRKRHDSHMLCAMDDEDRNNWIKAISKVARAMDVPPVTSSGLLSKLSKRNQE